jgi:anti-sigma B factor antagonist
MTLPDFKIEYGAAPGLARGVLVRISGPIDAKSAVLFKDQVEALRTRRIRHFLFEMGEVRHINSTGLAYIITLAESMKEAGGGVALVNVQPKVKVLFETMGLIGFVDIYSSPGTAVRRLRPAKGEDPVAASAAPAGPPAPTPGAIRRLFRRLFGAPSQRPS